MLNECFFLFGKRVSSLVLAVTSIAHYLTTNTLSTGFNQSEIQKAELDKSAGRKPDARGKKNDARFAFGFSLYVRACT